MGYLEQALAALDSARRTGGRNIQDLFSDPSAYAEKIVGHLPFIQDFIKQGKWSDIKDQAHTGLTREEIDALLKR